MSSINGFGVSTSCSSAPLPCSRSRVKSNNARTDSLSPVAAQRKTCESCRFQEICLGSSSHDERQFAPPLVSYRRHVKKDEVLYRSGAKCDAVYAIRAGVFKLTMFSEDGIGQITGFQMPGDLLGLDGIGCGKNRCDAVALSQGEVCVIPCANLIRLNHESEALQAHVLRALCDDIRGNHALMLLLGNRSAEERVAAFIVDLSDRLLAYGRPWSEFMLWMTRAEIGSFLGLKLETVSRVFSKLDGEGLVAVRGRQIQIRDFDALRKLIGGDDHRASGRRSIENENASDEAHAAHRLAKQIVERASAMSAVLSTAPRHQRVDRPLLAL
jgi:CRP/FNR family transcriptional regulator